MKGKYRIVVQNKKIKYDFEIKRNITVIRGDSATGKTALVDMIREHYENGADSGIKLNCDKECTVLEGKNWMSKLKLLTDSIVFIDEGNSFVNSKEFAASIRETDNYYVIVTRESLATLPYSVDEIYGIKNSGKYGSLKQTYNEFYRIYNQTLQTSSVQPDIVLTEDSNSGYQFFDGICKNNSLKCISAEGKSNIFGMLNKYKESKILIIADGAAFGSEMEKLVRHIEHFGNCYLYLPESFEWIILNTNLFTDKEIEHILEMPFDYIDGKKYFSWERFFSHLLVEKTKDSYLQYTKSALNPAYLQKHEQGKILDTMKLIDLKWKTDVKS